MVYVMKLLNTVLGDLEVATVYEDPKLKSFPFLILL